MLETAWCWATCYSFVSCAPADWFPYAGKHVPRNDVVFFISFPGLYFSQIDSLCFHFMKFGLIHLFENLWSLFIWLLHTRLQILLLFLYWVMDFIHAFSCTVSCYLSWKYCDAGSSTKCKKSSRRIQWRVCSLSAAATLQWSRCQKNCEKGREMFSSPPLSLSRCFNLSPALWLLDCNLAFTIQLSFRRSALAFSLKLGGTDKLGTSLRHTGHSQHNWRTRFEIFFSNFWKLFKWLYNLGSYCCNFKETWVKVII